MAKSLAFCSNVPKVKRPHKDLATPRDQRVAQRVASRLHQRAGRTGKVDPNINMDLPWNPASRRRANNPDYVPPANMENNRPPCTVCHAGSSRNYVCGARVADSLQRQAFTSFVRCVRSPGVPVLFGHEPFDQTCFLELFGKMAAATQSPDTFLHNLVRAAAVGAVVGAPDFLAKLPLVGSDAEFVSEVQVGCDSPGLVFRGGQPHGPLKRCDRFAATARFIDDDCENVEHLFRKVSLDHGLARSAAVRELFDEILIAGQCFLGRSYWAKRFIELLVLSSSVSLNPSIAFQERDVDSAADKWPVGPGTLEAATRICTGMKTMPMLAKW